MLKHNLRPPPRASTAAELHGSIRYAWLSRFSSTGSSKTRYCESRRPWLRASSKYSSLNCLIRRAWAAAALVTWESTHWPSRRKNVRLPMLLHVLLGGLGLAAGLRAKLRSAGPGRRRTDPAAGGPRRGHSAAHWNDAFQRPLHEPARPRRLIQCRQPPPGTDHVAGQVVDVDAFVGHERGVGREDAVPGGQIDQFLDQLVVLAPQVQLVEDFAHAADGPQLLDERKALVVALLDQRGREIELLPALAHRTLHDHLGRARPACTARPPQAARRRTGRRNPWDKRG